MTDIGNRESMYSDSMSSESAVPATGQWLYILGRKETWLMILGRIAWLVYLAADIGCIAGGYLSGVLIRRGSTPAQSRVWVMTLAAVLLPLSPLINSASSPLMAVGIAAVAAFAHLAWQISLSTLIVDIYPKPMVGTVFGLVAAGSGLGGMISTHLVGRAVTYDA